MLTDFLFVAIFLCLARVGLYCLDCSQMYLAIHKMANYESFTQRGGNFDQAFRNV